MFNACTDIPGGVARAGSAIQALSESLLDVAPVVAIDVGALLFVVLN